MGLPGNLFSNRLEIENKKKIEKKFENWHNKPPKSKPFKKTGGRLTEIHLTFSVDRNFLLIWAFDQNFYFFYFGQLIEFHLIFSVDQNFY